MLFTAIGVYRSESTRPDRALRAVLEQFVGERVPLAFIVNAIVKLDGQPCTRVADISARTRRVKHAPSVFSARSAVIRSWWRTLSLRHRSRQSIKGIWAGDLITGNGGTLIAFTAASEGTALIPLVPVTSDVTRMSEDEIETGTALDDKQGCHRRDVPHAHAAHSTGAGLRWPDGR
jgi:hypothetical protein